jgi:hypothetical protein
LLRRAPRGESPPTSLPHLERALREQRADERRLVRLRHLADYPDDGYLPIFYPYVAALPGHLENLCDPRFPLPLPGLIHLRTRITTYRSIRGGEPFLPVVSFGPAQVTDKGLEFALITRVHVAGELAWEGEAIMLRRKKREKRLTPPRDVALDGVGAVNHRVTVKRGTARAWALASGDVNPIHLSPLTARLFGFRGTVVHGMWTLARLAAEHVTLVRTPGVTLSCDFKLPLIEPTTVVVREFARAGGLELRVLDRAGAKPHVLGRIAPLA